MKNSRILFFRIGTIIFFGMMYLYTTIGVLIVLILAWLHLKGPIRVISQMWAKSVFFFMCKRFTITGIENVDRKNRYILLANHGSLFDILAIVSFYPGISWFGHERLLKIPLFGKILLMTDYVPFKEPNYRNTKKMIEQLIHKSKDQTVAIFPEGTRTLNGKINEFYRGFIYLFRTREIDILPVTLNGFYDLKPKNRFYIDFSAKLSIVIHNPIKREELVGKKDNEIIDRVKEVIESAHL